jgi:hypothetical protein
LKLYPKGPKKPDATRIVITVECRAIREIFGEYPHAYINNTKSFIGHTMGAAGAMELAGNAPTFEDHIVHHTINLDHLDPECHLNNLVINVPKKIDKVDYILNNSFGMLGINSVVIVKRFEVLIRSHSWNRQTEGYMTKEQIKDTILEIIAQIIPDEDLSNLKGDIPI